MIKIYRIEYLVYTGDLRDAHFDMFQVQDKHELSIHSPSQSMVLGAGSPPSGAVGCSDLFHSDCWQKSSTVITDRGCSCAPARARGQNYTVSGKKGIGT